MAWPLLLLPIGMEREDAGQSLRGVYVVLVDDDSRHREVLREILRYCGAWVREVDTGDEALAVLPETTPTALVGTGRAPGAAARALPRGLPALRPEHGGQLPAPGRRPPAPPPPAPPQGVPRHPPDP